MGLFLVTELRSKPVWAGTTETVDSPANAVVQSHCMIPLPSTKTGYWLFEIIHYIRQKISLVLMLHIMGQKVCFLIQKEFSAGKQCSDSLLGW